ncbi:MAG TPA: S9 family peptidase [Methylomirabilota bacterium]|nr:S9 family peptidase [Methylomirabilota bacterium]
MTGSGLTRVYAARPGARPMAPEDLWMIPRVGGPVPSGDGTWVAVPVTTYDLATNEGRSRIWRVPVSVEAETEPSWPLTAPEVSSGEPAVSPDGRWLAFTRKGANGKPQLHLLPLEGGEARTLTDLPLGVFDPRWLPDNSGLIFIAPLCAGYLTPTATATELARRAKDPVKAHVTEARVYRYWDTWLTTGEVPHLFVYDLASGAARDLTPDSTLWLDWMEPVGQYDLAPDGREVAFAGITFDEARGLLRSAIYTVPVAGGPVTCLTSDHPADDSRPRYSPDGRYLVYGAQADPFFYADRVRLRLRDRASGADEPWLAEWDLSPAGWVWGPDGGLYFLAEEDGRVSLFTWRGTGAPVRVVRGGVIRHLTPAGPNRLGFTWESLVEPPEVHLCAGDGMGLIRRTRFTAAATSTFGMGEVREARFPGAEGEPVQMFVVLPPGEASARPRPLVQVIHGGPHGIAADGFSFRWNPHLFAAPGYVAGLVNFQGSTSWGQDFARRIQGGWGDRPYQDLMVATDLLITTGLANPGRLAAAGGSYGGYLVAWIAGQTDRFRCLINHAGVFDLLSEYAGDVTQGARQAFGGEAWDGLEAIDRWSPVRFAAGMRTPMLVTHGERDFRVTVNQGLQCYGLLKAKGVPARLVYFPDENHWVMQPRNALLWYREVHAWLARFLAPA